MRVALLTTFHQRDGLATYAESLVEALRARGEEVLVLAPSLTSGDGAVGEQPPRLWSARRASIREAWRVARTLLRWGPDVVHLNVNLSLFSARFLLSLRTLLRLRGVPLVATLHGRDGGSPLRRLAVWRFYRALRGVDLVVHNDAHAKELRARGHRRVHVVPHGLPPLSSRPVSEARARLGLDPARPVLTHFGFLFPHKGVLEVVRAVADLKARGFPRLYYWICGAVYRTRASRRYFARVAREVARLGLTDDVHLTGEFVSEEQALLAMQAATLVVLNYRDGSAQGASGAVRRALSSGRPVAVSAAPFFDDVRDVTYRLDGDLVEALARALRDPDLERGFLGAVARRCVEAGWPAVAARHVALYRELVGRGD